MNWELIVGFGLLLGVLILGGALKNLISQVKELFVVLESALADDTITKEELAAIFKEAKDVKGAFNEIIQLIWKLRAS